MKSSLIILVSLTLLVLIHLRANGDPMDIDEIDINSTSKDKNVPKIFDYGKYVEQFKKNYSPIETLNKAKLFFGRTLKIFQHNVLFRDKKRNYFLGQNQFTDMTPEELKKYHAQPDSELQPVQEALKNPNLPASSSIIVSRIINNGKETDSSASLDDMDVDIVERISSNSKTSVVNFMDERGIDNLKGVLDRLKKRPDLANQLAQVIEHEEDSEEVKREEERRIEEAKLENKIQVKPVPKSNNENYDAQTIYSYGASRDVYEDFAKNYAKFLMNDPNEFGFDLTPYAIPDVPVNEDEEEEQEVIDQVNEAIRPLASLFGSMKSIYDFFTLDGYDESQDDDVAPTNVENPAKGPKAGVINYDIDWRKTGCITKPTNQKDCNACYAFTTLALMEFFHCRQTKQLTDFSPQYIVDCGPKNDLHGCQGGKLGNVGNFIRTYGIELAATYPYTAREGQCQIENREKSGYLRPQITAWQSFPSIGAWYKWLPKSPIIVGISMPSDFFGYAGGIHDGSSCDEKLVHALLLVGSGTQDGQEFWLLKNSYSDSWGEAGYFRLSKAAPMRCFNSAVVARPKFV